MKPGIKTTELWGMIGTIATLLVTVGKFLLDGTIPADSTGGVVIALVVSIAGAFIAYAGSRGKAKAADSLAKAASEAAKNPA